MSTRSAESRSNSPDGSPDKRASKKRKVLSCYACRNRKMKCDRVFPVCGRCARTGRADACTYDPRLIESLNGDGSSELASGSAAGGLHSQNNVSNPNGPVSALLNSSLSESVTWKIRSQERRIDQLEKKFATFKDDRPGLYPVPPSRFADADSGEEQPVIKETMMFRGKEFKTRFYGSTSPMSLIGQFPELQEFTRQAMFIDSSMARIKSDFKTFRCRRKGTKDKSLGIQYSDADIQSFIPEKSVVDQRVALYFQMFENTLRILHGPTFWKEYEEFWKDRESVPRSFPVTILLVNAITRNMSPNDEASFIGDSSFGRENASVWVDASDTWLGRQNRKHLTLGFFQALCLSLLAKRVNCVKLKQDWVITGDMIRLGMATGMHRDPTHLAMGKTSEFTKEMRRRIWATMMELEFQSSMDVGLPSTICGLDFDCPAPANIDDESLAVDSEQAPRSKPEELFTSTSYLSYSQKSLALRTHLMYLINSPSSELNYADVLHYDNQINTLLASIPKWDRTALLPRTLLDIQLRQFLIILHRPFAKLATTDQRYNYSFTSCISAGSSIISQHEALNSSGIHALSLMRNDVFRTAIAISQTVYTNLTPTTDSSPQSTTNSTQGTVPVYIPPSMRGHFPFPGGHHHDHNHDHDHDHSCPNKHKKHDHPDHHRDRFYGHHNDPSKFPNMAVGHPLHLIQISSTDVIFSSLAASALTLLDKTLSLQETKMMRLGTGYMEFWLMCAALAIMPSTTPPAATQDEEVRARAHVAMDRMTRLCYKVLALQEDKSGDFSERLRGTLSVGQTPMGSGGTGQTPGGIPTPGLSGGSTVASNGMDSGTNDLGMQGLGTPLADQGLGTLPQQDAFAGFGEVDLSGWTFPDFWDFNLGGDTI